MFDFSAAELKLYKDNMLPNINPDTGYRLHKSIFSGDMISEFHTHEYYEIFLSIEGSAVHYINNFQQIINPGSLVFIRPSDKHCFGMIDKNSSYEFINFAFSPNHALAINSYFDDIYDISKLSQNDISPMVQLIPHDVSKLIKKFDNINTIPYDSFTEQKLAIRRLLSDIIPIFFDKKNDNAIEEIPYWLLRTYNEMKKTENFIAGLDKMVELSGKTPEHLSRMLKKHYKTTPSQLVNTLRLNYAVNLLTNTSMKVIDICFEAGFINLSTFYNIFKDAHNITPNEYRKKYRIKLNGVKNTVKS